AGDSQHMRTATIKPDTKQGIGGAGRPFAFALAPTIGRSADETVERAEPLRAYLERALERPVEFRFPKSYDEAQAGLIEGDVDAAMFGELAAHRAELDGRIEPLVSAVGAHPDLATYRSTIITRIDSGIHDLDGLRGKRIGLVDNQSTSGYVVPRAMLREAGIDPDREIEIERLGSHRAVVEAVISGDVIAGALHEGYSKPPSLDRGPDYARLRFLARSRPIPYGPLVIRASLDQPTRDRLAQAMLQVHEADPEAAKIVIRAGLHFTVAAPKSSPTLKSIAALAGVSYATVSRVVNRAGYVAPDTAKRVSAIIKEVGYVPNGNARQLQGQQAPLVGFVERASGDPGGFELAIETRSRLERRGIPMVICPIDGAFGESTYLGLLQDRRLGALVVTEDFVDDESLVALARQGYVIVAISQFPNSLQNGMLVADLSSVDSVVAKALRWTRGLVLVAVD
ncbi:MAG: phosphate/phosphite/phosphonate ABC transporter substrate-binding protein, partial [Thermomicrobiales bacterium]